MTKLRNKLVLVFLALCIVACLGLVVACGGDTPNDGSVTYTVTVTAGDAAAEGVQVTVKKGNSILGKPNQKTDKNGKVEFKLAKADGYTVTLANLPEGYELPEETTLEFDENRNLVVALKEQFAYTVKLVNPDGSAFTADGVTVGICTIGGNCLNPVAIGADGIAKVYGAEKTDYHIQVLGLPAGYAYESAGTYAIHKNADGFYTESDGTKLVPVYVALSDTVFEQKITIHPVNVIKLTDESKLSDKDLEENYGYVQGMDAYKMNIEVAANTTAYYEYTAEYSGDYNFYAVTTESEMSYKLNESFLLGDSYLSGTGAFYPPILMEKGKTYYFNITNNGKEKATVELIMATPYATNALVKGACTIVAEVNKQGKNAAIELEPASGSTYKLTVEGEGAIKQATSSYMVEYVEFGKDDYKNCKELTVKYTEDMQGSLYFAVSVKADSCPASVNVKIEKIGSHTNTTTVVTNSALTQTAAPESGKELAPVALNATVVKGDDGKYHLGDKNGPVVYVNLTGTISASRYQQYSHPLVNMELATMGSGAYVFDVTTAADSQAADKGKTYKDFRTVLRGFAEYKYSAAGMTPSDKTTENYYANYVNEDGVYPLDDTLKEFLELASANPLVGTTWLFACYTYIDCIEPDVIVGTYETEDRQYRLIVEKFGGYIIDEKDGMAYAKYDVGTWYKSAQGEYSFVSEYGELAYVNGVVNYTEGEDIQLIFEKPADPIVGVYECKLDEEKFILTIKKNGDFNIVVSGEEQATASGTWSKNNQGYSFVFNPVEGYTYTMTYDNGEFTYDDSMGTMTFKKAEQSGEEQDEPDMTLVTEYNTAKLKLYFDTENTGKFKFYTINRLGDESEVCEGTFEMGQNGLTTVVTHKESDIEEASATTNEQGKIVVSVKYVDAEDDQAATYVFDMPSDEQA